MSFISSVFNTASQGFATVREAATTAAQNLFGRAKAEVMDLDSHLSGHVDPRVSTTYNTAKKVVDVAAESVKTAGQFVSPAAAFVAKRVASPETAARVRAATAAWHEEAKEKIKNAAGAAASVASDAVEGAKRFAADKLMANAEESGGTLHRIWNVVKDLFVSIAKMASVLLGVTALGAGFLCKKIAENMHEESRYKARLERAAAQSRQFFEMTKTWFNEEVLKTAGVVNLAGVFASHLPTQEEAAAAAAN